MTDDKDDDKNSEIKRNADGTFLKGFSGNPGGKLKKAQREIRDFAIKCLPDCLQMLKNMYEDFGTPIEIRERIAWKFIERVGGKIPDEPPKDDDDTDFKNMSGEKIFAMLEFAMQNMPKNQEPQ